MAQSIAQRWQWTGDEVKELLEVIFDPPSPEMLRLASRALVSQDTMGPEDDDYQERKYES